MNSLKTNHVDQETDAIDTTIEVKNDKKDRLNHERQQEKSPRIDTKEGEEMVDGEQKMQRKN